MKIYLSFIIAVSKMFFRRKQSIFWSLFFPIVIMLVFGNLNIGGYTAPNVGVLNNSDKAKSTIQKLEESKVINILIIESLSEAYDALEKGSLTAFIEISKNFDEENPKSNKPSITARKGDKAELQLVENLLESILDSDEITEYVQSNVEDINYQGYKGFLVPGVVAMAIMQNGIFSVIFTLLSYKHQGVLKRLQATPISPSQFIVGHLIARVSIIIAQTIILLLMGVFVFGLSVGQGNIFAWINILIFSLLGGILFLSIGLAISSLAPSEDSAPALANLVTFPMLFLSGVFFPIDFLPKFVGYISNALPLTHIASGIRNSVLYGNSTLSTLPQLGITLIWLAIAFLICAKTFKWE